MPLFQGELELELYCAQCNRRLSAKGTPGVKRLQTILCIEPCAVCRGGAGQAAVYNEGFAAGREETWRLAEQNNLS